MIAMRLPWGCCSIAAVLMWDPCGIYVESPVALLGSAVILLWYCRGLAVLFLWYSYGIAAGLLSMVLLWSEIAGGLLGYYYYYGIALGLLRYCCDLAVGFL